MGWTTTAMLDRYTSWMENESEEALEGVQGEAQAVKNSMRMKGWKFSEG